jgi:hypothetical protein
MPFFLLYLHVRTCHEYQAFLSVYIPLCLSTPSRTTVQHSTHAAPCSFYACMHMHVLAMHTQVHAGKQALRANTPS